MLSERELRLSAEPQGLAETQGRAPTSGCIPVWPRTNTWSCKDQGSVALLPSRAAAQEWQKAVQHSRGLTRSRTEPDPIAPSFQWGFQSCYHPKKSVSVMVNLSFTASKWLHRVVCITCKLLCSWGHQNRWWVNNTHRVVWFLIKHKIKKKEAKPLTETKNTQEQCELPFPLSLW